MGIRDPTRADEAPSRRCLFEEVLVRNVQIVNDLDKAKKGQSLPLEVMVF